MHIRTLLLCAFILWMSHDERRYTPIGTTITLRECLVAMAMQETPQRFVCLPETINPNQH